MNLSAIPIIDHHAHPLLPPKTTNTAVTFQRWFTESTDPEIHVRHVPHTLFWRTAVRWLSELLDCPPTGEAILAARAAQPYDAWVQYLFNDARIASVFCDYGYGGEQALSHEEMQTLLPCPVAQILRLETLAEALILQQETFEQMVEAFTAVVGQARENGFVALKSIIAYRSGLQVNVTSRKEARAAFGEVKEAARRHGRIRLASKPLCDFLVGQACTLAADQNLPVQFHTGFGDRDADLRLANPLHLRTLIEGTQAQIILLHAGWPYYRETAHLVALYSRVWLDLSLAIPLATSGIPGMLRAVLGLAPHSKILFATDAFTMPEIFWLAARWGRWGLGQVLAEFVAEGFFTTREAKEVAVAILGGNARTLYGAS